MDRRQGRCPAALRVAARVGGAACLVLRQSHGTRCVVLQHGNKWETDWPQQSFLKITTINAEIAEIPFARCNAAFRLVTAYVTRKLEHTASAHRAVAIRRQIHTGPEHIAAVTFHDDRSPCADDATAKDVPLVLIVR